MTFEFQPTFGEQYRANLAVIIRSWVQVVAAVVFAAAGIIALAASGLGARLELGWIVLVGVAMLAGWWVIAVPVLAAVAVLASRPGGRVPGRHAWGIEADGIGISMPLANLALRWDGVRKVRETREFFLFYVSSRRAYALPRRAVTSTEDLDALRRLTIEQRKAPAKR